MKIAKERIIFDNYNGNYEDWMEEQEDYDLTMSEISKFFEGKKVCFFGQVGLWHGVYSGGDIGNFMDLFYRAVEDCAYIKIYDVNGHFHISCTHHDGSHHFEVKEITDSGLDYYDRWQYGTDNRNESYVHTQIFKRYSRLPNFSHKVWGCKAREYEESTKGNLINRLNNEARSFYS